MKLIGEKAIDVALLPIGDNYTMGPADALPAADLLQPKLVVPMNFDAFPLIEQDRQAYLAEVAERTGGPGTVSQPGESLVLVSNQGLDNL
jgi:L-ascorbate metabolism protein UlaG (beta-lactamase superfamily)